NWRPTLRRNDRGVFVSRMQDHLGIAADGTFGGPTEQSLRAFQGRHGLAVDAVCGPATWAVLDKETPAKPPPPVEPPTEPEPPPPDPDLPDQRPILRKGSKGEEVKIVQRLLTLRPDGDFGDLTDAAVRGFQRGVGINVDGIVS